METLSGNTFTLDPVLLAEIELLTDLIVAVQLAPTPLCQCDIDVALGLTPEPAAAADHRPARIPPPRSGLRGTRTA